MKRTLGGLFSAFAYFTILPLGSFATRVAPDALAVSFLPFAGAVVGALAGGAGIVVAAHSHVWWPIVAWALSIALTGAIHVDGFLDSCDALFASVPVARRLEILRDPSHGTFAIVGMVMLSVVWLVAISAIPLAHLVVTLAFAATLARLAAVANALIFPYGRPGAVTAAFAARPSLIVLACAVILTGLLGWFIDPLVFALVPGAIAVSLSIGWWASRRLGGGLTGDVFGAIVVVVETLTLVALASV